MSTPRDSTSATAELERERVARIELLRRAGGAPAALRAAVARGGVARAAPTVQCGPEHVAAEAARPLDLEQTQALIPGDPGWPEQLCHLRSPPALLFVRGCWPLSGRALAVVGSREIDPYGEWVTRSLVRAAVGAGWIIVSGGARGVDTLAHEVALDCGGATVVVLGAGVLRPYPRENYDLFERVRNGGGALISEYLPRHAPRPAQFPERNRIIAALADTLLVTQARRRSGALITARHARQLGRPVLAVPGDIDLRLTSGTNALLASGAHVVAGPIHLATLLGRAPLGDRRALDHWPRDPEPEGYRGSDPRRETAFRDAGRVVAGPPELEWLWRPLAEQPRMPVDDLVAATGRPTPEVLRAIVELELGDVLRRLPNGEVQLIN